MSQRQRGPHGANRRETFLCHCTDGAHPSAQGLTRDGTAPCGRTRRRLDKTSIRGKDGDTVASASAPAVDDDADAIDGADDKDSDVGDDDDDLFLDFDDQH